MKNLKKLSAAFMLAALLSSSLTSCIDNEVSPVVETIYENQAALLEAQARVQDANATLVLAQAAAQDALTAHQEAITANFVATSAQDLLAKIAATEQAVEEARIAMLLAQAKFDQDLLEIADAIRTAANVEAGKHAADYAVAMGDLAELRGDRLDVLGEISAAELFMKSTEAGEEMTWAVYLANLERAVLAKEAEVLAEEAFIERANTYLGDVELMQAAYDAAEAAETAKQAEINALLAERGEEDDEETEENEASGILGDLDTEYAAFEEAYETLLGELNDLKEEKTELEEAITELTDVTIPGLEATIADYDGMTETLEAAVAAALATIGGTPEGNHANNHAERSGLLGDIADANDALGVVEAEAAEADDDAIGGTSPTLYQVLFNAQIVVAAAEAAKAEMEADFADLTVTYNNAATALVAAQNAFDTSTDVEDLADAQEALTDAQEALTDAMTAYTDAEAAFVADPTGSNDTDGAALAVTDLGETGIHSDDPAVGTTYMEVATWDQPDILADEFFPGSFTGVKYTPTTLATRIAELKLATTNNDPTPSAEGEYEVPADTDYVLWNQDGTAVDANGDVIALPVGDTFLTAAEVVTTQSIASNGDITKVYFVEVESDDDSVSKLSVFNAATTVLGPNDFSTLANTDGEGDFIAALDFGDDTASYDASFDVNGEEVDPVTGRDTMTAYANVWNAQLAVDMAQATVDAGDLKTLEDAQKLFDDQQELYNNGLANISDLQDDIDTAEGLEGDAQDDVDAAEAAIALLEAELGSEIEIAFNNDNLPLSFDEHANDGIANEVDYIYNIVLESGWDQIEDEDDTLDTFTAYAILWNAQEALAIHTATGLTGEDGYNAQLAEAKATLAANTLLVPEKVILITRWQADVDALTAEYDALMETPIFAALTVRLKEIADEIAVLTAEKGVLTAEKNALAVDIAFEDLEDVEAIEGAIVDAQEVIAAAPAFYAEKAAQIALGEVSVADLQDEIESLTAELADLDTAIANKIVEVEGYFDLLQAALASGN